MATEASENRGADLQLSTPQQQESFESILGAKGTIVLHDESGKDGQTGRLTGEARIGKDAMEKLVSTALAECSKAPDGQAELYFRERIYSPLRHALMRARTGGITGECFEDPGLERDIQMNVGGEVARFESAFREELFRQVRVLQLMRSLQAGATAAAQIDQASL